MQGAKILNDGRSMPRLGLGVFRSEPGPTTFHAVLTALQLGYRHIDTAAYYRNEESVGEAIRASGLPREQVFVTTKLASMGASGYDYEGTMKALKDSLRRLGMDYVDMYLIHSPNDKKNRLEQWRALEDAKAAGLARSIGVSNYGIHHLEELEKHFKTLPATNQVELHPWLARKELVAYCTEKGIVLTAYSPLAKASKMADAEVLTLASKHKCTPAQVLIKWSLQQGFVTIPKSTNPARIKENMQVDSFELSEEDLVKMKSWDCYMTTGWDPTRSM
ncbi:hypothetical protein GUITHDRAFT_159492 [Guillardia theta CCMP2712]|uniref:NADP-dependent oxidoreductase domain-containing protein n=1 Tax=Guillardia theta (strain CCMP2712) TaxID=905079 RepID=L1JKB7_GUITC|nr:hypothetical protein GUITHDRAFT_159492 [Guillardia theta CCMP2712]EKX48599.1 hypothetical protein GUITHDRAFT_159492 [Guillardia theta CCMP2712]|eukprot:XP_005835579.1 hypothetical protein GUITHDRAFT_159492 [Guillardia theta CCMP2712]